MSNLATQNNGQVIFREGDAPQDKERLVVTQAGLLSAGITLVSVVGLGTIGVPLFSITALGSIGLGLTGLLMVAADHVNSVENWEYLDSLTVSQGEILPSQQLTMNVPQESNFNAIPVAVTAIQNPVNVPVTEAVKPTFHSQSIQPIAVKPSFQSTPTTVIYSTDANFIDYMSSKLKSTLIVGIPGAGKGLTTKVLITEIRKKHPGIFIMGIDPKLAKGGKEDGYWEVNTTSGYDVVERFRLSDLGSAKGLMKITKAIAQFKAVDGKKLLVMDEGLSIANTFKSNKFELGLFIDWMVYLTSMGDSEEEFLYYLSQSGNLAENNFPSSVRNCMDVLVLATLGNDALLKGVMRTDLIVEGQSSNTQNVKSIISRSEVGRAFYHNIYGEWFPMPRLKNHSNYDRDTRSFSEVNQTPSKSNLQKSNFTEMLARSMNLAVETDNMDLFLELGDLEKSGESVKGLKRLQEICLAIA